MVDYALLISVVSIALILAAYPIYPYLRDGMAAWSHGFESAFAEPPRLLPPRARKQQP